MIARRFSLSILAVLTLAALFLFAAAKAQVSTTRSSFIVVPVLGLAIILAVVAAVVAVVIGISLEHGPTGTTPAQGAVPGQAPSQVNTHTYGWTILSFLVSLLWFKINNNPVFPLGFLGGLFIAFWFHDIDRALGKPSLLQLSVVLAIIGMVLGLIIR